MFDKIVKIGCEAKQGGAQSLPGGLMFLLSVWQTRWGAGPGRVAIDREVVYSDMTDWRRFGREP